jgi:hypothetical protein
MQAFGDFCCDLENLSCKMRFPFNFYNCKKIISDEKINSKNKFDLDLPGIDPGTSHMLSERSTI